MDIVTMTFSSIPHDARWESHQRDMEELIRRCNQSIVDSQKALTKYDAVQEEIQGARSSVIGGISRLQRPSRRWRRARDDYADGQLYGTIIEATKRAEPIAHSTPNKPEREDNPVGRDKILMGEALTRGDRESSPRARVSTRDDREMSPLAKARAKLDREASPMAQSHAKQERESSPMARAIARNDRDPSPLIRAVLRKEREHSPMARTRIAREGYAAKKYIVPPIILSRGLASRLDHPSSSFEEETTGETEEDVMDAKLEQLEDDLTAAPDVPPRKANSSYAQIVMPESMPLQERLRRYRVAQFKDDEIGIPISIQEKLRYRMSLLGDDDVLMPSSLTLKERLRYRMSLLEDDLDDEVWERIASRVAQNNDSDIAVPISTMNGETLYYRVSATDAVVPRGLFHHAARNGDLAMVQTLVMDGVDVNDVDGEGMTGLHHAVSKSQVTVAKFLLSLKSIIVNMADMKGKSPLHYAVENGHTPVLVSLLAHGAFPNSTDNQKQTPLHKACRDGKHNIVDILLDHGASLFAFDDAMKAPLHYAVENNHPACVTTLLKKGAPVNNSDGDQRTPLHYAAQRGFFLIADILLSNGAMADALDKDMKTALFIAVQSDFISMTRTLISYNASVNTADIERLTPLHIASVNGNTDLVLLLLQHGGRVDAVDCANRTPISYAVDNNEIEVVQLLLQYDASVTIVDLQDMTPLHYSAEIGNEFLVHLLADHELKHSSSDTTYKRLLDVAFKYQNELLGSMTMNHALKGYSEIIQQDNQTEKNKREATEMMKSLLNMVCKHFSHYHGEKLVRVWPGYKELAADSPMIVVNVSNLPKVKPNVFMGLPIVYKLYGLVSDESIVLSYSKLEIEKLADPLEIMAIQRTINRNIARLKLDHSNLVKVSASAVRSLQNGSLLAKEACIVLYCKCKGVIPFGEKPFPKYIEDIPVDIRDGLGGDTEGSEHRIIASKHTREAMDRSRSSDDSSRKKLEF
ncbi:uncharacterized protein LOC110462792 isoform X2 [Mizuhopecten yessoensis]|uniref:uncharacterized protein LOC110462792 isoform X2 n=1 Tax=Mizuhopecten yessoensis TaxID=6573 RepID=UPI000B458671|nr:uncharacterized protein LOC110462792 isoform X2 [Mizuhopecten yessoensis]